MTISICTRHLSVAFQERTVVQDVSLELPAEGISVLLGRSGSGKTTFLRALNRLNECFPGCRTQGEVDLALGGRCVSLYGIRGEQALSEVRRRVGMVFQTPNILPVSIRHNMLLPLELVTAFPRGELEERMERSLEDVGLWQDVRHRLDESASVLSGGQQQRLCLARTLALEPEILLLDEPTASLDPATTLEIEALLQRFSARYPMLLVSHGLAQARHLASRLVLFAGGRMLGTETPEFLQNDTALTAFFGEQG